MRYPVCNACDGDDGNLQNTDDGILCERCRSVRDSGIRIGEQRERQRVVAHVAQVVEAAAGMGGAPWPIMKAILEKLQGEFERGEHIAEDGK